MNVVVLAPHQDDEILSACLYIQELIDQNNNVSVVFATNGDYKGKAIATLRAKESLQALSKLGITDKNIYFMGYGDTGMRPAHSFLLKLYNCKSSQIHASQCSFVTYNPLGGNTVHSLLFGEQALYTRYNFTKDLNGILCHLQPQMLIVPSRYDYHGDHQALGYFVSEIFKKINLTFSVYSYLIHAGNDLSWPNRNSDVFLCPACIPQILWDARILHHYTTADKINKSNIIQLFTSQDPFEFNGFLHSFAKRQEFFLIENVILPA